MRLLVSSLVSIGATSLIASCIGDSPSELATPSGPDATTVQADAAVVVSPSDGGTGGVDAGVADAEAGPSPDAGPCDRAKPFGAAGQLFTLGAVAFQPQLTPNELTIFFSRSTTIEDAGIRRRIFIARRGSTASQFDPPTEVVGLGTQPSRDDHGLFLLPSASASGRILLLSSERGPSSQDYYRVDADPGFTSFNLGPLLPVLSSGGLEGGASITQNGSGMYFTRYEYPDGGASGRGVLYHATLNPSLGASAIARVPGFEARDVPDGFATITPDDLALYFSTLTNDGWRIHVASRTSVNVPFGAPVRIDSLDGTVGTNSYSSWVSADECRLYFARSTGIGADSAIYVAERPR